MFFDILVQQKYIINYLYWSTILRYGGVQVVSHKFSERCWNITDASSASYWAIVTGLWDLFKYKFPRAEDLFFNGHTELTVGYVKQRDGDCEREKQWESTLRGK